MRYSKKIAAIPFILVFLVNFGSYATEPKIGGDFIFATSSPVQTLDPHLALDKNSIQVCETMYQPLVKYSTEDEAIGTCLAISWQVKEQGKEWIFHLRKGIKFHDGTPLNADAVVFSFQRQLDPTHPYYEEKYFHGRYLFGEIVDKVRAVDEYTVRFTLKIPYMPFIYSLTNPAAMIVSPEAVKAFGENFYQHSAGTGPFKLLSWKKEGEVVLERYEDYWGEKAYLYSLIFRPILQEHRRIQDLIEGEIESAQLEDVAGIKPAVEFSDRLTLIQVFHLDVVYLALNMRKGPLNRVKVREAVHRAINKEKLQEMFYPEKATVARGLIPPTLWGYNPNVSEYEFDPGRAKELLKEARVEKLTLSLLIPDSPVSYLPDSEGIAQEIKDDLAGVGIEVQVIKMDWRSYLEGCEKGEHHMALTGWRADFPDPDNFLYPLLDREILGKPGSTNWSFYQSSFFHEILERARQVSDEVERTRLYQEAQKIVQQDIPCIPLIHTKGMIAFSPEVEGVAISSTGMVEFEKVWISEK